jgi:hypothetical protein
MPLLVHWQDLTQQGVVPVACFHTAYETVWNPQGELPGIEKEIRPGGFQSDQPEQFLHGTDRLA